MIGGTRGRPLDGVHFVRAIFRTPFVTLLAWASAAYVSVLLTQHSAEAWTSLNVDDNRSITVNSSIYGQPLCWETQGLHEHDCFHDEPLTSDTYPLTLEMLKRASSRYTTTDLSLHRSIQRARKRGQLKVVVVGGSVTAGHGCLSPAGLANKECAWPHRLQRWCDERIDDFTCEVINAAVPGCNIQDFLHNFLRETFPVEKDVDLIIVDFGVNDAVLEQFDMDTNNVKLAHEVFIRYVRNYMINMPALLYAESFVSEVRARAAPLQASNMAEVHAAVTRKYDIPMVSFRDAVWPDQANASLANRVWGSDVHPDWQVQQLLADVLVYYIEKSYARFLDEYGLLSDPTSQEEDVSVFEKTLGCLADERSFKLYTRSFVGLPPPEQLVHSVKWAFSGDTSRRGGLIGFGNSSENATVSFDLPCSGDRQVLDIGYLKSYTGMGAVRVVVQRYDPDPDVESDKHLIDSAVVVIDGLWETKASVEENVVISTPNGSNTIRVTFVVLSADTERFYANFLSDIGRKSDKLRLDRKFKITSLQCC